MDKTKKHRVFNNYIIRTPILSRNEVSKLTVAEIRSLCKIPFISEAIYIASPELHGEMEKFANAQPVKDEKKLVVSLLKYFLRMGNRSTPFGLFSGCSVGQIADQSTAEINDPLQHKRATRLDMNYLCALSQKLEEDKAIRDSLTYYPNTSLYKIADKLRYIEFKYEKTFRRHFTVSIDDSEYVALILKYSQNGASIKQLAGLIDEPDISEDDAVGFINELIDNQVLVSSISPYVTGSDYFQHIKNNISSENEKAIFANVEAVLDKINNCPIGEGFQYYEELYAAIKGFGVEFNKKFLLQTDLTTSYNKNTIGTGLIKRIDGALTVLNKLAVFSENESLTRFKKDFYKKYEEEEIPLAVALDVEAGIGYSISNNGSYDISPLIDDISLSGGGGNGRNGYSELKWTRTDMFLNKKMLEAVKTDAYEIAITDEDVKDFQEDWQSVPNTFSTFISILDSNPDDPRIFLENAGNITATAILGRFCHSDQNVKKIVEEIVAAEKASTSSIFAEIVHLPEKRTGNVLFRPHLRDYEIPYLAKSTMPLENQIPIEDIMVSIKSNTIILRSKKLNKRIIPRLATAHNYSGRSLPIYYFLGDMQSQGINEYITFGWGNVGMLYNFFPRVVYNGVILCPAHWLIRSQELKKTQSGKDVAQLVEKHKLPSKVLLADGDNQLLIDFEHELSVEMFLSMIKNSADITLIEYLFTNEEAFVRQQDKTFCHEIVLSYHNAKNN